MGAIMNNISSSLSKQLNMILKKDDLNNTFFSEEELNSIIKISLSKKDLDFLNKIPNIEELELSAFPSVTKEDIVFISTKLKKVKNLIIKEQNALFSLDLRVFDKLEELSLIHNDNLQDIEGLSRVKKLTFYDNKDFNNIKQIVDYMVDNKETRVTLDISYYIMIVKILFKRNISFHVLKRVTWVETIGLRKYVVYEYTNEEIDSLMKHISYITSMYIYTTDRDIDKFSVLYKWVIDNMRFVNEDDPEGENLSLISNVNKVLSYKRGGRLTLAKTFQMLLSFVGIDSSVVYSMGATDIIGYHNGEKVCSLLGESDYAVLRVTLDGRNYYCDIAWDTLMNYHGFFDKLRSFLFSKKELKVRHKFVGEGNIDSSYSYHGDDSDDLIRFASSRIKEVNELFEDVERLKNDITGKEFNIALFKLKVNDLKNYLDELEIDSDIYKEKVLELTDLENKLEIYGGELVRLENERDGIINSYANLLIRRYLSDDTYLSVSELRELLEEKESVYQLSEYLSDLLKICLKNKTA